MLSVEKKLQYSEVWSASDYRSAFVEEIEEKYERELFELAELKMAANEQALRVADAVYELNLAREQSRSRAAVKVLQ
jgi:hypothetical protein